MREVSFPRRCATNEMRHMHVLGCQGGLQRFADPALKVLVLGTVHLGSHRSERMEKRLIKTAEGLHRRLQNRYSIILTSDILYGVHPSCGLGPFKCGRSPARDVVAVTLSAARGRV